MDTEGCYVSFAEIEDALKMVEAVGKDIEKPTDLKGIVRSAFAKSPECAKIFDTIWDEEINKFFRGI